MRTIASAKDNASSGFFGARSASFNACSIFPDSKNLPFPVRIQISGMSGSSTRFFLSKTLYNENDGNVFLYSPPWLSITGSSYRDSKNRCVFVSIQAPCCGKRGNERMKHTVNHVFMLIRSSIPLFSQSFIDNFQ